ncbi:MAG: hypothetical protein HRU26_01410 [Psychroserpens sp.]|nr:hypothetical protein [Psychroserpens sp.]
MNEWTDCLFISSIVNDHISETTSPEEAMTFNYQDARKICSNSDKPFIAFPVKYLVSKQQTVIKRRNVSMHRGRGWREVGCKDVTGLSLHNEMKALKSSRRKVFNKTNL